MNQEIEEVYKDEESYVVKTKETKKNFWPENLVEKVHLDRGDVLRLTNTNTEDYKLMGLSVEDEEMVVIVQDGVVEIWSLDDD